MEARTPNERGIKGADTVSKDNFEARLGYMYKGDDAQGTRLERKLSHVSRPSSSVREGN